MSSISQDDNTESSNEYRIRISRLSSPAGSVSTVLFGRASITHPVTGTEDAEGFIYIRERMGWIRVKFMPFSHPLPLPDHDQTIYYGYTPESIFGASPQKLDHVLPQYIHGPSSYSEFSVEEMEEFDAIWYGAWDGRQPRNDPAEVSVNITKLFSNLDPISDEEWEIVIQYDALCDAAKSGYESESVVRRIVGDAFFDASGTDDRYYLVQR